MRECETQRIRVYGIVQGVGFRPTVSRHAALAGIRGTVCNKGPYVEIYAQGSHEQTQAFLELLRRQPPRRAAILKVDVQSAGDTPEFPDFSIIESEKTAGEIFISPDIAVCGECKRELFDKNNRRYLHPFINCTSCGPRLTILDALPYDRERTSMKSFPMCPACAAEYTDPATRRYDAQPVCCPSCGPQLYLLDRPERGREALLQARKILRDGGILAVKGIGGFHLCCDASDENAVRLLRQRKGRPMKPFAVMLRDETALRRECEVPDYAMEVLTGHQKPIVLLPRKNGGCIAPSVAPDNPRLGVMLPYAPVQLLLFDYDDGLAMPDALVMTSGNVSGAPICRTDEDARTELSHLCDAILSNDRPIRIRADDTVLDFFEGQPYMVRRSRGYAPLPFVMSKPFARPVLAVGGELKNSFCIGKGELLYPSPYVGDMTDLRTVQACEETITRFGTLLETEPALAVCDMHPDYNSTALARKLGLPLLQVQHHYAHILSCMAENGCDGPVIGVSLDGTGYGTDGTIWGGEILLCDTEKFTRFGHIAPFLQTGGDVSAREGRRIAMALLQALYPDEKADELIERFALGTRTESTVQRKMAQRGINTVRSTSAGRLFDAVSALLGIRLVSTFESEASTALQFAAERWENAHPAEAASYAATEVSGVSEDGMYILPTQDIVRDITEKRLRGADADELAWLFHARLARQIADACIAARDASGLETAALSGGCWQNLLLLRLTVGLLRENHFNVLIHRLLPPNDGGIAAGQALAGLAHLNKQQESK